MRPIMPPVATPDNMFHEGNPLTGELGTILPAAHLNNEQDAIRDAQAELIAILTAAGKDPDSTAGQLLAALKLLFAEKNDSLGALSSLVGAENKLPYFTGNKTAALADFTAIGRDIVAATTNQDVLDYLGIGKLGSAALSNVGTGLEDLPTTRNADTRYMFKHWVSPGSVIAVNTPLVVDHGLTIDPDFCVFNIKLKCVTANNGYAAGDYCIGFASRYASGDTSAGPGSLGAVLTSKKCQFNPGSSGISIMSKNSGYPVALASISTLSQWSFEFHILYQ